MGMKPTVCIPLTTVSLSFMNHTPQGAPSPHTYRYSGYNFYYTGVLGVGTGRETLEYTGVYGRVGGGIWQGSGDVSIGMVYQCLVL